MNEEMKFDIYRASEEEVKELKALPETGMGYQLITTDGSGDFFVFNCEYLIHEDDYLKFVEYLSSQPRESASDFFKEHSKGTRTNFTGIELKEPKKLLLSSRTKKNEMFYRYSAFENDKRVVEDGSFSTGTYATTFNDVRLVPSGLAAVGRYALPNPFPAKFVYILLPEEDTSIQLKTVTPAFNQAGGGVEVFFPEGGMFDYMPHLISEN